MGLLRRRRGRDLPAPAYSNEAVIGRIEGEDGDTGGGDSGGGDSGGGSSCGGGGCGDGGS